MPEPMLIRATVPGLIASGLPVVRVIASSDSPIPAGSRGVAVQMMHGSAGSIWDFTWTINGRSLPNGRNLSEVAVDLQVPAVRDHVLRWIAASVSLACGTSAPAWFFLGDGWRLEVREKNGAVAYHDFKVSGGSSRTMTEIRILELCCDQDERFTLVPKSDDMHLEAMRIVVGHLSPTFPVSVSLEKP